MSPCLIGSISGQRKFVVGQTLETGHNEIAIGSALLG